MEIWGTQKETKKLSPTERVRFTSEQLQLRTSNHGPRSRDGPGGVCDDVGCARQQ